MTPGRDAASAALTLVVATHNQGKLLEFQALLAELPIALVSLRDVLPGASAVEERGLTFAENAILKARAAAEGTLLLALADDSGLEVDALSGAPGVWSARYAGSAATDTENNGKLLQALEGVPVHERTARFRCVLAVVDPLAIDAPPLLAEGRCEGRLRCEPAGHHGFGYDPLFEPVGLAEPSESRTMAELDEAAKNGLSHRGAAVRALIPELRKLLSQKMDRAKSLVRS